MLMELCGKPVRIGGRLIRIATLDAEGYQFLEDPEAAVETLRNFKTRVDLFTFIQRLSDTSLRYSYPMEWDNIAALRVSNFDDWIKHQIDFKARNKLRKAEKSGVVVREVALDEDFVHGITAIYNECPVRQGKPFWHYGKDHETVNRMMEAFLGRTIFLGAFCNEVLIGFVQLVTDEDCRQAGLMQIVSKIQHRDKAPTNALIAQAVRSCAERKIRYLWYANFSYGKKQPDSLADFKRHNGFQKVEIPRYYVPLTVAGRMTLRLNLQHGISGRIPEPVASRYRNVRTMWYARKFPRLESG
jgi:hypothetical protein